MLVTFISNSFVGPFFIFKKKGLSTTKCLQIDVTMNVINVAYIKKNNNNK